jgi:two-component system invasion response regulator UvrY
LIREKLITTLIIDDHAIVRQGLRQILTSMPDVVVTGEAETAREGLKMALENQYNMILLDINLPDGSGLDILKQLKIMKSEAHVLILSMYPEKQYAIQALRLGAFGYLTKACATEELGAAIRSISAGHKYVTSSLAEKLASHIELNVVKPPHESLSDREYQVMLLLASGKTVGEIAKEQYLSAKTISTYRHRILGKMNLESNTELTYYALENRLISLEQPAVKSLP